MAGFVGKVAVITGSGSGIGRQITKKLINRGLTVAGLERNMKKQQELANEMSTNPEIYVGKFHSLQCDISQEAEIREAFATIKKDIGSIAILINNAAIIGTSADLTDTDGSIFDAVFNTNVKAAMLCATEALKSMNEQSEVGHIININSVASLLEYKGDTLPLYTASKEAMKTISRAIRREIHRKKQNVKVSIIYPGGTDTNLVDEVRTKFSINSQEMLPPEEVANACLSVLDTPPNVLISELVIMQRQTPYQ